MTTSFLFVFGEIVLPCTLTRNKMYQDLVMWQDHT